MAVLSKGLNVSTSWNETLTGGIAFEHRHFEILFQGEHARKTNLNLATYAKDDGSIFFATMYDGKVLLLNAGKIAKDALSCCGRQVFVVCAPGGHGIQNWRARSII